MKLSQFYQQVIKFGVATDPRKNKAINSFEDTAILYGNADTFIKRILVGIDIEVGELLLAQEIRRDAGLDLVISHHPEGSAWANFYKVMKLQIDVLAQAGIARGVAAGFLEERMREVERKVLPANHMRSVDAARLLDLPFMCIHTPADNHAFRFIERLIERGKPAQVKDVVEILKQVPEYQEAAKNGVEPRVILGNPKRKVGKVLLEMTGGTEGSKDIFDKLQKAGVRTLICMHLSEEHFKKVRDANLNVVIAGHISSDTLGLNLLLDKIEKEAGVDFQIINCSGFRRIKRK